MRCEDDDKTSNNAQAIYDLVSANLNNPKYDFTETCDEPQKIKSQEMRCIFGLVNDAAIPMTYYRDKSSFQSSISCHPSTPTWPDLVSISTVEITDETGVEVTQILDEIMGIRSVDIADIIMAYANETVATFSVLANGTVIFQEQMAGLKHVLASEVLLPLFVMQYTAITYQITGDSIPDTLNSVLHFKRIYMRNNERDNIRRDGLPIRLTNTDYVTTQGIVVHRCELQE